MQSNSRIQINQTKMKRSSSTPLNLALTISLMMLANVAILSSAQSVSTPCTSAMINSFTPCMNYITGSSSNGTTTPTADCCSSLKALTGASMDCACLLVTASVPLPSVLSSINRSLAVSLPKACKSSVPVQCQASASPLAAPGPAQLVPSPSSSAFAPQASKAAATGPEATPADTPAFSPADVESPPAPGGIRPVLTPSGSYAASSPAAAIVLTLVGLLMALELQY